MDMAVLEKLQQRIPASETSLFLEIPESITIAVRLQLEPTIETKIDLGKIKFVVHLWRYLLTEFEEK